MLMPTLVRPTVDVHDSWLEAVREPGYEPRWADDLQLADMILPDGFARYVQRQLDDAREDTRRSRAMVPSLHLWYVDDKIFLGRLSIRLRLTPWLRDYGGHVGYDVRPSARRHGHATAMLHQARPWLADVGIDPALVTCDVENVASRKVIESAGGQFQDELHGKLRYWLPATPGTHTSAAPLSNQ